MTKIHNPNPWTASVVGRKFQVYRLVLAKNEFNITATTVPPQCRFPAPNDSLGVNTYRGNSFVRGRIEVIPHAGTPFVRERGEELVKVRWATEGGAEFNGLDDYNEFWCVTLSDPSDGIYLQANYPLEPGESITIPNREMERNVFVLEGTVSVEGRDLSLFSHAKLSKAQEYTITNNSDAPAFVLYLYEVTPDEFIAAGEPSLAEDRYRLIPILNDAYWSVTDEPA